MELPPEVFTHPMRMSRSGSVPALGGKASDELFSYKQYSIQPRRTSHAGSGNRSWERRQLWQCEKLCRITVTVVL